jgi:O-methyltransferase
MIKKIIHKIIKFIALFGGLLRIDIHIAPKKKSIKNTLIDKYSLEGILNNDEYISLYYKGLNKTGMTQTDNFYKQCRSYILQQMLIQLLETKVEGNVAECGCWKGHSSYIIATILKRYNFKQRFNIFDSFEGGLSDKKDEDLNSRQNLTPDEINKEKLVFSSMESDLHQALKSFDFYDLYKGWIPERFNEVSDQEFIFVHIDVDLYQPTLDSLNFFYPRLKKNGVIIVDDYGYSQFPGAKKSVDDFLAKNNYSLFLSLLTGGCLIIK